MATPDEQPAPMLPDDLAESFLVLADTAREWVLVVEEDLRVRYINAAACEPWGLAAADVCGRTFSEAFPPEVAEVFNAHARHAFSAGGILEIEDRFPQAEGELWLQATLRIQHSNRTGEGPRLLAVGRDVTRRRQAEQALHTSHEQLEQTVEQRTAALVAANQKLRDEMRHRQQAESDSREYVRFLQTVIDSIPVPVFYKDPQGQYLGCNHAFARFLGRPRHSIIGKTVHDVARPEFAKQYEAMDRDLLSRSGAQVYETSAVYADGSIHHVVFHKATFCDTRGRPGGLVGAILDVTEQNQALDALARSESLYRTTIDSLRDALFVLEADWRVSLANEAMLERLQEADAPANPIGRTLDEAFPFRPPSSNDSYRQVFQTARAVVTEETVVLGDREATFEVQIVPVLSGDCVSRLITVAREVTESRKAERALRASERRYRLLVESLMEGVWVIDPDATTTYVNPRMAEMLGYTAEEMVGRSLMDFMTPENAALCRAKLKDRQRGLPENHEFEFLHSSGRVVLAVLAATPLLDETGLYLGALASVMDITEQRRIEKSLADAHRRLMAADEKQRLDLARDLHDSVGQEMIALNLAIQEAMAHARQAGQNDLAAALDGLSGRCKDLAGQVRRVCHGLYPPTLEALGLAAALGQLARSCEPAMDVQIECDEAFRHARLPADVEIALYRIAQESVSNVLRHSGAETLEIDLLYEDGVTTLRIADDGQGFDPASVQTPGLGLATLRERASAIGAELGVESDSQRGTRIHVDVAAELRSRHGDSDADDA